MPAWLPGRLPGVCRGPRRNQGGTPTGPSTDLPRILWITTPARRVRGRGRTPRAVTGRWRRERAAGGGQRHAVREIVSARVRRSTCFQVREDRQGRSGGQDRQARLRLCLKLRQRQAFGIHYLKKAGPGRPPPWRVWAELPKVPTARLGRWNGQRRESPALLADRSIPGSVAVDTCGRLTPDRRDEPLPGEFRLHVIPCTPRRHTIIGSLANALLPSRPVTFRYRAGIDIETATRPAGGAARSPHRRIQ